MSSGDITVKSVRGILTSGCTILRYPMGMDAHIAFNSRRHKRMPCFHERQIPPQMGIHCNQLKAICVCLWSWRRLGASQLHASGPWPSVASGRLWSESVLSGGEFDRVLLKKYTVKVFHCVCGSSLTSIESNITNLIKNIWLKIIWSLIIKYSRSGLNFFSGGEFDRITEKVDSKST